MDIVSLEVGNNWIESEGEVEWTRFDEILKEETRFAWSDTDREEIIVLEKPLERSSDEKTLGVNERPSLYKRK